MPAKALMDLRKGSPVEIQGVTFVMDEDQTLRPGDFVIAQRNLPYPQLVEIASVNHEHGYIVPVMIDTCIYPYDFSDCVKVKEAIQSKGT